MKFKVGDRVLITVPFKGRSGVVTQIHDVLGYAPYIYVVTVPGFMFDTRFKESELEFDILRGSSLMKVLRDET